MRQAFRGNEHSAGRPVRSDKTNVVIGQAGAPAESDRKDTTSTRLPNWTATVLAAAVLALVGMLSVPQSAAAAGEVSGPWIVWSHPGYYNDSCMETAGRSTANSAIVQQYTCSGAAHQQWYWETMPGGYVHIKNVHSGKCLNVKGASTSANAPIIQYTCGSSSSLNDQWYTQLRDTDAVDWYRIRNRKSGMCLNVKGSGPWPSGTDFIQYPCSDYGSNDVFTWHRA